MARRKPRKTYIDDSKRAHGSRSDEKGNSPSESQSRCNLSSDGGTIAEGSLSPWGVRLVLLAVGLHFCGMAISYFAIVEPSRTQSELLDLFGPYLRSTHFGADGRPFYLAHATPDEQPHRLQYATADANGELTIDRHTEWTTIEPIGTSGLATSDRYHRWMALVGTLSQSDQPSLAAALLTPLVRSELEIDAIRLIRLPTELTTAEEDAAGPVYLARVIRRGDQVQMVAIESDRLTTYSRSKDPQEQVPATRIDEAESNVEPLRSGANDQQ